jgi:hypothetical protein
MSNFNFPLFPDDVIKISRNKYITKKQLKDYVLNNYQDIVDQYCIYKKFNSVTGEVDRKYAWHSIIDVINRSGLSDKIIQNLTWTLNEESQN